MFARQTNPLRPIRHLVTKTWLHLCSTAQNDRSTALLMVSAAILGLVGANLPATLDTYQAISTWVPLHALDHLIPGLDLTVKEWVQDGMLTLFFLVIGLDLRQEMSTGTLRNPRQALTPMLAAIGGVIAPIGIYWAINHSDPTGLRGWAIPTATDVAFSLTALRILAPGTGAGRQSFLMTLAVFDDIIGILLIAVGYSHLSQPWMLLPAMLCLGGWYLLMRMRRVLRPIALLAALGAWYGFLRAGIHPVLSGVALGLLTPGRPSLQGKESRAESLSRNLTPLSALLALPLFAFLSMGIPLRDFSPTWLTSPIFLGITIGLALGKPLGIMSVVLVCSRLGLRLPSGIRTVDLGAVAQLCGIGFTMSFLIADLAYSGTSHISMALVAVLAGSALSFLLAAVTIAFTKRETTSRG